MRMTSRRELTCAQQELYNPDQQNAGIPRNMTVSEFLFEYDDDDDDDNMLNGHENGAYFAFYVFNSNRALARR